MENNEHILLDLGILETPLNLDLHLLPVIGAIILTIIACW